GDKAPPATAFKWSIGHLIAGAGIVETVLALGCLRQGVVPGVATLSNPDPQCAGVRVMAGEQNPRNNTALILCRGFAGPHAALIVAKEACAKLFPRELALGLIEPIDFSVARDGYGAPQVVCSARAQALIDQQRIRAIVVSLTHDRVSASAVALALAARSAAPI